MLRLPQRWRQKPLTRTNLTLTLLPLMSVLAATAHASSPVPPAAYQRAVETMQLQGQDMGPAQQIAKLAFAQCNAVRTQYGLAENWPEAALLQGIDRRVIERFYQDGMARTRVEGYTLAAADFERWQQDSRATPGSLPATPPDCSQARKQPIISDQLWRDGQVFSIDHLKKRIRAKPYAPSPSKGLTAEQWAALPTDTVLGHSCIRITQALLPQLLKADFGLALPTGGASKLSSCLWQQVPLTAQYNFPWPLQSHSEMTMAGSKLIQDVHSEQLTVGKVLPSSQFELPAGYSR